MPTLLIPIANHLFSPESLKAAADEAMKEHPGKSTVLKGAVDAKGVSCVLAFNAKDDHVSVQTAFSKDWKGSYAFGASGSLAW